ncbi:MAG: hypothetical protein Q7T55_16805 [Solirubrobacteraceae bacterium]|nr:hypothetical protein [Solirubrobacteraceae bacterium]
MATLSELIRLPVAVPQQLGRDLQTLVDVVSRLPELIARLDGRLAGLVDDVAVLRETVSTVHVQVATLGGDVSTMRDALDRTDARVARLEMLVTSLEGRVVHIDDGLDDRIPDLSVLPDEIVRIRRDIAKVLELTPDPNEPGTLDKVRDALTPSA